MHGGVSSRALMMLAMEEPRMIRYLTLRGLMVPVTALIVLVLAVFDPLRANFGWSLSLVFSLIIRRTFQFEQTAEDAVAFADERSSKREGREPSV